MKLFDLHCDTITVCSNEGKSLFDSDNHISLKKASEIERWIQLFAIWIPDEYRGKSAIDYFNKAYNTYVKETELNSSLVVPCSDICDADIAYEKNKSASFLTVEGGAVLDGKAENLDFLYKQGVRLMTLTWNGENELGYGCRASCKEGLKSFGKNIVKRMESIGIMVDVSHLNNAGFWDVAKITDKPFVASHSNSAEVLRKYRRDSEDSRNSIIRSLEDDQIKLIIERGGLIGINFCDSFLGDKGDDGFSAVLRNVEHILELGGEKCLALGSDFDGCNINTELAGIEKMPNLYDFLSNNGIDKSLLDDIFFYNAYRFFKENI